MDIDKQKEEPTGVAGGDTSHDHDSLSHDLPTSITDEQKAEPARVDTGDVSHEHPSMSHDLDVATAASPVDHSGIQGGTNCNEGVSPGSLPQSPDDGGMGDAYTKRGYTSEIFKIELSNLPRKIGFKVCNQKYRKSLLEASLNAGHKESPGVLEAEPGEDQEARQCSMALLCQLQV